ncbi:MAG: 16S rRNA (cytosine(1402)-N(4))-methyltransferase RsmH [Odoribacteraceae bacterium]|jgi:16S rRNA (cytosine1402-N4)-methyltransferase|nr:16S rRNA (cytosine(1402)-N(4))-methyltransferase RsmH [Odoribacteraceae bacterium]
MYHKAVLLEESVTGLNIQPGGIYLDLTFGGGGHAREILKRMSGGRLIGFDRDAEARENVPGDDRFIFVNHNFRYLSHFARYHGYEHVDGILADLGVSWHDFDTAERGFSFRFDAPLDMRMDRRGTRTAADVLNESSEEELERVFREYGEVENARQLARLVAEARGKGPILRTGEFLQAIQSRVPAAKEKKYLARVFQALRIEVNEEMEALEEMLRQASIALRPGGRLVVITYHSLEDRVVKNFLRSGNFEGKVEKDFHGREKRPFELVNRKVIVPAEEEIEENPRARSAKLRVAEKTMDSEQPVTGEL